MAASVTLLGMWDEGSKTLTIRRPNGQTYKVPGVRRQNNLDEFGFRIAESLAHQG